MGYSDLDVVKGIEGLVYGLSHEDVRKKYDTCYEGIPTIVNQTIAEVRSINFGKIADMTTDWNELKDSWGFI